jgi:hypothetical protein
MSDMKDIIAEKSKSEVKGGFVETTDFILI